MADQGAGERTEQPTARRLTKSRQEGRVAFSQEFPSALVLITMLIMLWLLGPYLMEYFNRELVEGLSAKAGPFENSNSFLDLTKKKLLNYFVVISPIMLGLTVASIAGCVAVSGFAYSPGALKIKMEGLNPITGMGRLFSAQALVTLILSLLKLALIVLIVYFYLRNRLQELPALRWMAINEILVQISQIVMGIFLRVAIAVLIIGIADLAYQKWKYIHDLKMTRQEVKQERREDEGSPEIKRKIRSLQIEMARKRMLQEVPKANVVLVNPTHVAVALKYDAKNMTAPVMVAKGGDHMCEKIKEIARAYGVPIVHRPELARSIFAAVEPGQTIPEALYLAVAEVLAMIYRLRHRR